MLRFFALFLLIQGALLAAELMRPVQQALVIPFTEWVAWLSAWSVQIFDPEVVSHGKVLQHLGTGFAVSIEAGCNGVEATLVLVAAILAFPAPWLHRLVGIGVGFVAIQAVNLLRIISLFYLGQWSQTVFDWAHLYVWQALIMLDVLFIFLIWLRFLPASPSGGRDARGVQCGS